MAVDIYRRGSIFVLDISGSMNDIVVENNLSRLVTAKNGIKEAISTSYKTFNGNEYVKLYIKIVPFDTKAFMNDIPLCELTSQTYSNFCSQIDGIRTRGGTAIYKSLAEVLDNLNIIFPKMPTYLDFVLLTDGDDNSSGDDVKKKFAHLEALLSQNKGKLNCISFVISQNADKFVNALQQVLPPGSKVLPITNVSEIPQQLVNFVERSNEEFKRANNIQADLVVKNLLRMADIFKTGSVSAQSNSELDSILLQVQKLKLAQEKNN